MDYFRSKPELRVRTSQGLFDFRTEPQVSAVVRLRDTRKGGEKVEIGIPSTPLVTPDAVIVAAEDGTIRSLSRDLKEQLWKKRFASRFYASPVFVPGQDLFVIGSHGGDVHAMGLDGDVKWSCALGSRIFGAPAVVNGRIYVPVSGHQLVSLRLDNGDVEWKADLPVPWNSAVGLVGRKDPYSSICSNGNLTVLGAGDCVVAIDPMGRELWRLDTGAAVRGTPALSGATGVAGNVAGRLIQFSLVDGSVAAEHRVDAKILSSPALLQGCAFFADENGGLTAWDLCEGQRWHKAVRAANGHNAISVLPDASGVCFLNDRGNLVAVSRDGDFLWESAQGVDIPYQNPRLETTPALCADGHMYVTSYTGFIYQFSFKGLLCKTS